MLRRNHRRIPAIVAIAFALALAASVLGGCVYSDTITEVILNNEETSQVDPDITPVIVNTLDASETSDALPKLDEDDADSAIDTEQSKPLFTYDSEKVNTQVPAPRPVFAREADATGEVADKAREDATEQNKQESQQTQEDDPSGSEAQEGDTGNDDPSKGGDSGDQGEGGDGEGGGTDPGTGEGGGDGPGSDKPGAGTGNGQIYTSDVDAEPVIPEGIDEVAAVGNNAVIVSIVSGTAEGTSLVACDSATKEQAARVLAQRGIGQVPALWGADGASSGDLTDEALSRLVSDAKPDLVYVTEGASTLTDEQVSYLQSYDIDIYYLPKLTSPKRIRFAVKVIGMTLAKGGVDIAEQRYTSYLDFENSLVARYTDGSHNGGLTGGYDFDLERDAGATAPTTIATLFIDKWDADARYKGSLVEASNGVAVATLGYAASPVSYYMSVGGALNNAAARPFRTIAGSAVVWQFAPNELDFMFDSWSGLDVATYDLCRRVTGGVFKSCLLWNNHEVPEMGFGTENFPAVVAKSQLIGERFTAAQASPSGSTHPLYSAYPLINPAGGKGSTLGFFRSATDERTYIESCIGRSDRTGKLSNASADNTQVFVNPKGLCQADAGDALCSWTDGSIESVLEASWVYWKFRGGSEGAFNQDVIDFYQQFYGYDVSGDLAAIVGGAAS